MLCSEPRLQPAALLLLFFGAASGAWDSSGAALSCEFGPFKYVFGRLSNPLAATTPRPPTSPPWRRVVLAAGPPGPSRPARRVSRLLRRRATAAGGGLSARGTSAAARRPHPTPKPPPVARLHPCIRSAARAPRRLVRPCCSPLGYPSKLSPSPILASRSASSSASVARSRVAAKHGDMSRRCGSKCSPRSGGAFSR